MTDLPTRINQFLSANTYADIHTAMSQAVALLRECAVEIDGPRKEAKTFRRLYQNAAESRDIARDKSDRLEKQFNELRDHCERVTGTSPVDIGENMDVLEYAKINQGALIMMDHQVWTWPNLPNATPDMIFQVVDRVNGRAKCTRDGFGTYHDYGNGALWVNESDLEKCDLFEQCDLNEAQRLRLGIRSIIIQCRQSAVLGEDARAVADELEALLEEEIYARN